MSDRIHIILLVAALLALGGNAAPDPESRSELDPFTDGGAMMLRALFLHHAREDGILEPQGLSEILAVVRRVMDRVPWPFPVEYTLTLHAAWRGEGELTEDIFMERYPTYLTHRDYLWRQWLMEMWNLPGPNCRLGGFQRLCCEQLRGYGDCFNATYTYEWCCGTAEGEEQDMDAEEQLAARAEAVRAAAAAPAERHPLRSVIAAERSRAAFAGCEELSCSCALRPAVKGAKRLAVLQVGIRERYYPLTTLRHVVGPAAREGYDVDYFAMIAWNLPRGQRFRWSKQYLEGSANPMFANTTKIAAQDYISRLARRYGARRVQVHLLDPGVTWDPLPAERGNRLFGRDSVAHPTFRNYLLKLKKVEMLWNRTRAALEPDETYSHVVLVRDDVHWLDDIQLKDFPDAQTVYSHPMGFLCQRPAAPDTPAEHVFVMGGAAAERLLRAYREYYDNPSAELDAAGSTEQFWYVLARLLDLRWDLVRRDRLPYMVSMYRQEGNESEFCLRGPSLEDLARPTGPCVHPSLVRHKICDGLR